MGQEVLNLPVSRMIVTDKFHAVYVFQINTVQCSRHVCPKFHDQKVIFLVQNTPRNQQLTGSRLTWWLTTYLLFEIQNVFPCRFVMTYNMQHRHLTVSEITSHISQKLIWDFSYSNHCTFDHIYLTIFHHLRLLNKEYPTIFWHKKKLQRNCSDVQRSLQNEKVSVNPIPYSVYVTYRVLEQTFDVISLSCFTHVEQSVNYYLKFFFRNCRCRAARLKTAA